MARFSVLSVLVTVFYFLLWTTQVSTPSHSNISLRIIEVLPQFKPILTISAPPPTRSLCAGINHCDKSPIYETWALKFVGSANQARGYLNVYNFARTYLLQVDRYFHQVTEMLGHPTPDSLVGLVVMPTTGKLAAPPLGWICVEASPPTPPTPPTRTLPVYALPTPTTGPWNPPTPTTGHSRVRSLEPVVETDSDHWFQQAMFIGSSLILTVLSFVRNFKVALALVNCVEHQDTKNGGTAPRCDAICPVVPPKTEASATQVPRKSSLKPPFEKQQDLEASLGTTAAADSEPLADATSDRNLDLVSNYVVPLAPFPPAGVSAETLCRQLGVTLHQLLRPNNTLHLINQTLYLIPTERRADRASLSIEWHPTQNDAARLLAAACPPSPLKIYTPPPLTLVLRGLTATSLIPILPHLLPRLPFNIGGQDALRHVALHYLCAPSSKILEQGATSRSAPLLLERYPRQRDDDTLPSEVVESSPRGALSLKAEHSCTSSTTLRPLPRALTPSSNAHSIPTPNLDQTKNSHHPPYQLSIECYAPPQGAQLPGEVEPHSPPTLTKVPLRIPPSFYRYANVRLEDLDGYPPEERDQILRREIQIAEERYRLEKPRRDRSRFRLRFMQSEMKQKGERRKCKEEIEDDEEMERVIRARHLVQEEVFEGVGGPDPPVPEWLLDFFDMLKRDCTKKKEKERKGILKKGGEGKKKGKSKVVRWMDECGRRLAR
ncbi:hypothetical protein ACGC1H_005083 [Rhizoctonia solani]